MSLEGKDPSEIEALASLAESLSSNPATRQGFLRLTKQVNPTANIPEIDTIDRVAAGLKPHLDRLKELEQKQLQRDVMDRIQAGRERALQVSGVTAADMPAIEKLMQERQIPDHATAAEFHAMQQRAAEPTAASFSHQSRTFGAPQMPDAKEFGGNLQTWSRNQAYATIDEMRGRKTA